MTGCQLCVNKPIGRGLCRKHYDAEPDQKERRRINSLDPKHKDYKAKHAKLNYLSKREARAWQRFTKHNPNVPWIDRQSIKDFYNACPRELTVDHILPLKSSVLCGLHVAWNLQYLTPEENSKKKNNV